MVTRLPFGDLSRDLDLHFVVDPDPVPGPDPDKVSSLYCSLTVTLTRTLAVICFREVFCFLSLLFGHVLLYIRCLPAT